jgi:arabinogalactan oligomer/maltooligosaccharide transport system permease protein
MTAVAAGQAVAPRRPWRQRTQSTRTAYLFLLPALLLMAIITFYPLVFQIWMAFTDFQLKNLRPTAPGPNIVGLENFTRILDNDIVIPNFDFLRILTFNLFWAFSNVVIHVVIGVAVALVLNVEGLRFKRIWRAVYILPIAIPPIIVATVWRNMFDPQSGAVNLGLQGLGGLLGISPDHPAFNLNWLRQPDDPISWIPLPLAYYAMLMTNTWLGWPLNSVVATGALQSIPGELYEAAEMDGASPWQKFRNVTIPFLRPAMLPYAIYGFVVTFNLFFLPYFMSAGEPFGRTEILVTQAFRLAYDRQLFGVAAAFCVYLFLLLLVVTLITNRLAKATKSYAD